MDIWHCAQPTSCLEIKVEKREVGDTVMLYCLEVNYLLLTYAMDDVYADMSVNMMQFTQLSNKSATKYADTLYSKALR